MNARSVCNKTFDVNEFITDNDLDACAITETWLKGGKMDDVVLAEMLPTGFSILHCPRLSRGGGVALVFKQCLHVVKKPPLTTSTTSFEYIECLLDTQPPLRVLVLYRPPSSKMHVFREEFDTLMEHLAMARGQLLILGDFNIQFDNANSMDTKTFVDLADSYGLVQHVKVPTHSSGHTLDMAMSLRMLPSPRVWIVDPAISDHHVIMCSVARTVPGPDQRLVNYRSVKKIDCDRFTSDIALSALHVHSAQELNDANTILEMYNGVLVGLLDKHAPMKSKVMPDRDQSPWYTDELRRAKQERRQLERRWLKTGLLVHRDAMVDKRRQVNSMVRRVKSNYYVNLINEHRQDPRRMFDIVSRLLGKVKSASLPKHSDSQALASQFSVFFVSKVEAIKASIASAACPTSTPALPQHRSTPGCTLSTWSQVTSDEVRKIITHSSTKHCALDPLPTWLLKRCLDPLLPSITALINLSLTTGTVPDLFKVAHIVPLLKKPSLDASDLSNYRPVSNLPFLSKVLERVVNTQLTRYITENNLQEKFQSAYRQHHSTETALIRVQNDILLALSERKASLLLLLDLSAAFDTVEHTALIDVLCDLGLTENVISWFKSYLSDRTQKVRVDNHFSSPQPLKSGVPQGSVLGPVLFTLYTASLGRLIQSFNLNYHFYADDSSLYLTFEVAQLNQAVDRLTECTEAVRLWMGQKKLKMNSSKTELLFVTTKNIGKNIPDGTPVVQVGENHVKPSDAVRYIGVLLDKNLNMNEYINSVCKAARFHLYNIGRIRHLLTRTACEQVIHAFVTSRLDYGNALLYGLPQRQLSKLQRIQNSAARIVARTRFRDHITPVLQYLHWLPVPYRIIFKIALLVFKCVHGQAPVYLRELLHTVSPQRDLRSSQMNNLLTCRRSNNSTCDRAFETHAPLIWNSLPEAVRGSDNIDIFKKNLKTYLFTKAYF